MSINPIASHLVAHVMLDNLGAIHQFGGILKSETVPPFVLKKNPQEIVAIKEQLKVAGWYYEAFPTFYYYDGGKGKACLYMETPPNLSKEKHHEWIKLLLNIYSEGKITDYKELHPSKKHGEKPRIVGFNVNPHQLNRVISQSKSLPTVIAGFDALKGADYRLSNGVDSGIKCFELMLSHITVKDGAIQKINIEAIEKEVLGYINGSYKKRLETALGYRQQAIDDGYDYFSDVYVKALTNLSPADTDKKRHYQLTACTLAYQAAMLQFFNLPADNKSSLSSIEALNKCLNLYVRALQNIPVGDTVVHSDINFKLRSVIAQLHVALSGFNIEIQPTYKMKAIRSTLVSLKQHNEHLDDAFGYHAMLSKIDELIEKAGQLQAPTITVQEIDTMNDLVLLLSQNIGGNPQSFFGSFTEQSDNRTPLNELLQNLKINIGGDNFG